MVVRDIVLIEPLCQIRCIGICIIIVPVMNLERLVIRRCKLRGRIGIVQSNIITEVRRIVKKMDRLYRKVVGES